VPVIVIEDVAAGVPESTLIVATEVMVPPEDGVTGVGLNETCTPDGSAP